MDVIIISEAWGTWPRGDDPRDMAALVADTLARDGEWYVSSVTVKDRAGVERARWSEDDEA